MLGFFVFLGFIACIGFIVYISHQFTYNTLKSDLTGKFIIITGASSGLGEHTAIEMIKSGAKVIFACRNETRANASMSKLPADLKDNATFIKLDLCSFESINSFAQTIKAKYPKIDILINNAGAQPNKFNYTEDKMESFIQGNHIGPVYLTFLLLDHFANDSKVICVSSCGHYYNDLNTNSHLILSDIEKVKEHYFKNFAGMLTLYGSSKLMNLYFAQYLAELFKQKYPHIKSAALHPGFVNTNFFRYLDDIKYARAVVNKIQLFWNYISKSTEQGAQTHLYLCYLPFDELESGGYYVECKRSLISRKAKNAEIRKTIMDWTISEITKRVDSDKLPEYKI